VLTAGQLDQIKLQPDELAGCDFHYAPDALAGVHIPRM
jgi:hypothetical protein